VLGPLLIAAGAALLWARKRKADGEAPQLPPAPPEGPGGQRAPAVGSSSSILPIPIYRGSGLVIQADGMPVHLDVVDLMGYPTVEPPWPDGSRQARSPNRKPPIEKSGLRFNPVSGGAFDPSDRGNLFGPSPAAISGELGRDAVHAAYVAAAEVLFGPNNSTAGVTVEPADVEKDDIREALGRDVSLMSRELQ